MARCAVAAAVIQWRLQCLLVCSLLEGAAAQTTISVASRHIICCTAHAVVQAVVVYVCSLVVCVQSMHELLLSMSDSHKGHCVLLLLSCNAACWSRHPASGYVQGMNDLVTPFLAVFLSEVLPGQLETWTPDSLSEVGTQPAASRLRKASQWWRGEHMLVQGLGGKPRQQATTNRRGSVVCYSAKCCAGGRAGHAVIQHRLLLTSQCAAAY